MEEYMTSVLKLMKGHAQFNQFLIGYLKFQPYSVYAEQSLNTNTRPDFYDTFRFPLD